MMKCRCERLRTALQLRPRNVDDRHKMCLQNRIPSPLPGWSPSAQASMTLFQETVSDFVIVDRTQSARLQLIAAQGGVLQSQVCHGLPS